MSQQKLDEYHDMETITPEQCDYEPEKKNSRLKDVCQDILTARNKRNSLNMSINKVCQSNNDLSQNINSRNSQLYKNYNSQTKTAGSYNKKNFWK